MTEKAGPSSGTRAFLVYTVLRLGLVLALWWLLQLVTPLRGLLALVVSILASGVISLFLLNRPRQAMGEGVAGFFGRLNARIDAGAAAEDEWDEAQRRLSGEQQPEQDAVDPQEQARPREDGDEGGTGRP